MRSVVPLDSATVPVPDHEPSKPAKGPLACVLPAETDSNSAAPTPAAVRARPNRLEANKFMVRFPIIIDPLNKRGVSPHPTFSVYLTGEVQIAVNCPERI